VLPEVRYRLRCADGREAAVQGGRLVDPRGSFPLSLDLGRGELRPGLINAHDHLHRNHYPRLGAPPYRDAYEWGQDIHARDAETIARARCVDRRDALLFGALKNLLGGVTTVVHHDPWEPAFNDGFPLRVASVRTVHSLGIEPERAADPGGDPSTPLCIHLAEGTTPAMAAEVHEARRLGLLTDKLLAVHAVGVDPSGVEAIVRGNVSVVWCPTSNFFLFGRTAPPELLSRASVLLGSDSLLTGAGTLLDELRHARATGLLDDRRLLDSVSSLAADKLGIERPRIATGAPADLAFFSRPLVEATSEDVALVLVGGVPQVADECHAGVFDHLALPVERLQVGSKVKLVSAVLAGAAQRILADWPDARRIFWAAPSRSRRRRRSRG
jgi:hypothetical protein